jgi:hypothetical protein
MQEYHEYVYEGPVLLFNNRLTDKWKSETTAPSESKARNNLAYQYKKNHNMPANSKISLPGKLKMVD